MMYFPFRKIHLPQCGRKYWISTDSLIESGDIAAMSWKVVYHRMIYFYKMPNESNFNSLKRAMLIGAQKTRRAAEISAFPLGPHHGIEKAAFQSGE